MLTIETAPISALVSLRCHGVCSIGRHASLIHNCSTLLVIIVASKLDLVNTFAF